MPPRIFISHSAADLNTVGRVVALLRAALVIEQEDIRCTSLPGYGLPGGSRISDVIRSELRTADLVIGLISPRGFASAWVLFELGARWGVNRHLIPLLAPGVPPSILEGPIREQNALSCDRSEDLERLVAEVASEAGCELKKATSYTTQLEAVLALRELLPGAAETNTVKLFFREHPSGSFYPSSVAKGSRIEREIVVTILERLAAEGFLEEIIEKFGPTYRWSGRAD